MAECSVYMYSDSTEETKKGKPYKKVNLKDIFPVIRKDDGALTRVHSPINKVLNNFFERLKIEEGEYFDDIIFDCPGSRKIELEIFDGDGEDPANLQYALIYQDGRVLSTVGNLPEDAIVAILIDEGAWEGIPEEVKDLYRRLIKRIADESKKYAKWQKEREELEKKKEKTKDDIKKIRDLTNKMERSLKIVSADMNRVEELKEQYPGIEKIK